MSIKLIQRNLFNEYSSKYGVKFFAPDEVDAHLQSDYLGDPQEVIVDEIPESYEGCTIAVSQEAWKLLVFYN